MSTKTTACMLLIRNLILRTTWSKIYQFVQNDVTKLYTDPWRQLRGLKGSAAKMYVPNTTANLPGSSGIHASMGHGCLATKGGDQHNIVDSRWMIIKLYLI